MQPASAAHAAAPPLAPRDRLIALASLGAITLLAWLHIVRVARGMDAMAAPDHAAMHGPAGAMALPTMQPWGSADAAFAFIMWAVMMVAMMTPSAAPLVLMFHRMQPARVAGTSRPSAALIAGYLTVWIGFSIAATALQGALHTAGLLARGADRVGPALGGALFVVVGAWQFTPLKHACLTHCRSPMDFLVTEWRAGTAGAFVMGLRHGAWCLGCCWALMLVLFAAGIMNLFWIAVLAGWILLEKTLPAAIPLRLAGGIIAIAAGSWRIIGTLLG